MANSSVSWLSHFASFRPLDPSPSLTFVWLLPPSGAATPGTAREKAMADIQGAVQRLCDSGHPHYQEEWEMRCVSLRA